MHLRRWADGLGATRAWSRAATVVRTCSARPSRGETMEGRTKCNTAALERRQGDRWFRWRTRRRSPQVQVLTPRPYCWAVAFILAIILSFVFPVCSTPCCSARRRSPRCGGLYRSDVPVLFFFGKSSSPLLARIPGVTGSDAAGWEKLFRKSLTSITEPWR